MRLWKVKDHPHFKVKDDTHCGCGYWPFITSMDDPLLACCINHDDSYVKGSWEQLNSTRKETDKKFYRCCMKIVNDPNLTNLPLKITLEKRANKYYRLVRWLGWIFWEGKK